MTPHPFIAVALTILISLNACQPDLVTMSPQETKHVEEIVAQRTPRCIGRHVVDLPKAFVIAGSPSAKIGDVHLNVTTQTRLAFDEQIVRYKAKLEATRLPISNLPYLGSITSLSDDVVGVLIDRAESEGTSSRAGRVVEVLAWKDGFAFHLWTTAINGTFPEDSQDSYLAQRGNDVPARKTDLLNVLRRTSGRNDYDLPSGAGLCIANGFVAGSPEGHEDVSVAYQLKGSPDLWFNLVSSTSLREEKSLFDRSSDVEKLMSKSGTKTLRKQVRTVAGVSYQEWLMTGVTTESIPGSMLVMLANETDSDVGRPFIRMELFNGFRAPVREDLTDEQKERAGVYAKIKQASLTAPESVALWDLVSSTLRPHHGA